jgi:preprotein translocase subunit YajC
MNLFIAEAFAENGAAGAAPQGSPYVTLLMLVAMFAAFYFLLIRPQAKRAKEHKALISALAKGDEVVTSGGTLGRVTHVGDNYITLEVAAGVEIKVQRHAIQTVLPKGTIKSA